MRSALVFAVLFVLAVAPSLAGEESPEVEWEHPLTRVTPSELWALYHIDEITDLVFPVARDDALWDERPRVGWRFAARIDRGRDAEWFQLIWTAEGLRVQKRVSKGASLWDQAVAAHGEDQDTTPERIAAGARTETLEYTTQDCPELAKLGKKLKKLSLGKMEPLVIAGFSYRYRLDVSRGHWLDGQWGGSDRDEPGFNTPIVNWIVRLRLALERCDSRRSATKDNERDAPPETRPE